MIQINDRSACGELDDRPASRDSLSEPFGLFKIGAVRLEERSPAVNLIINMNSMFRVVVINKFRYPSFISHTKSGFLSHRCWITDPGYWINVSLRSFF